MQPAMSPSSIEAAGFAVVLGIIAVAAVVSLLRRPRSRPPAHRGDDHR
jgi:hypothetical protein